MGAMTGGHNLLKWEKVKSLTLYNRFPGLSPEVLAMIIHIFHSHRDILVMHTKERRMHTIMIWHNSLYFFHETSLFLRHTTYTVYTKLCVFLPVSSNLRESLNAEGKGQ